MAESRQSSAFVDLVRRNVVDAAYQHVGRLRQLVFGFDALRALIVQGRTPAQVQLALPTSDALCVAFRALSRDIVTSAVGRTVAQLAADQRRRGEIGESSQALEVLKHDAKTHIERFAPLHFDRLYTFIEHEMLNGSLVGDPAWHDDVRSPRRKKRVSWRVYMREVLEEATTMFDETACKVDWTTEALDNDERKKRMSTLDDETLAELVQKAYASVPVHLTAGPKKEVEHPSLTKTQEEADVQRLGHVFDMLVGEHQCSE